MKWIKNFGNFSGSLHRQNLDTLKVCRICENSSSEVSFQQITKCFTMYLLERLGMVTLRIFIAIDISSH